MEGFIWSSPEQRAAITRFINFLSDESSNEITLKNIPKTIEFQRPNLGKNTLKQRFIDALRMKQDGAELLKASITYLHGIDIPKFVKLTKQSVMKG